MAVEKFYTAWHQGWKSLLKVGSQQKRGAVIWLSIEDIATSLEDFGPNLIKTFSARKAPPIFPKYNYRNFAALCALGEQILCRRSSFPQKATCDLPKVLAASDTIWNLRKCADSSSESGKLFRLCSALTCFQWKCFSYW